jgi:hypothetical protein
LIAFSVFVEGVESGSSLPAFGKLDLLLFLIPMLGVIIAFETLLTPHTEQHKSPERTSLSNASADWNQLSNLCLFSQSKAYLIISSLPYEV